MNECLVQYGRHIESGKKEELQYIYISFLRSSVLTRLPFWRIDLYDERNRQADITECGIYLNFDMLQKDFYKAFPPEQKKHDWTMKAIWLSEFEQVNNVVQMYFSELMESAWPIIPSNVSVYYGEYIGSCILISKKGARPDGVLSTGRIAR